MIVIYCKKWNTDIRLLRIIRIIKSFFFGWAASCIFLFPTLFFFISLLSSIQRIHCQLLLPERLCVTYKNMFSFVLFWSQLLTAPERHLALPILFCLRFMPPWDFWPCALWLFQGAYLQVCRKHWKLFNYFTLKENSFQFLPIQPKNVSVKGEGFKRVFWHVFNLIIKMCSRDAYRPLIG